MDFEAALFVDIIELTKSTSKSTWSKYSCLQIKVALKPQNSLIVPSKNYDSLRGKKCIFMAI